MPNLLQGRHALVTGGGSGIGRSMCRGLAALGATVYVVDLDADAAERVSAEIVAGGGVAHPRGIDVADSEAVESLAESVFAAEGRLDVLQAHEPAIGCLRRSRRHY